MEEKAEILAANNVERNIEEWLTLDVRGQPNNTYQKRILGAEAGG